MKPSNVIRRVVGTVQIPTCQSGSQEHTGTYAAGDLWGCVGVWFSGRWHTEPAEQYIAAVKDYVQQRIWTTRDFREYR